ncbi:Peptidyl-prolyl cis-trans isomerase [Actinidia chinensis var. chinensis]|uniref:Peptidyl-prolyl cis-trans isomerase n=1 Tax=Actinidia chinensis var. chinensis TaxID=1590841 RepID=A0A2R6R4T2_ACTCC|nr:Peptidyl-prolyl cis-trans isomerase [Actinidia chinensis var. chinensis]
MGCSTTLLPHSSLLPHHHNPPNPNPNPNPNPATPTLPLTRRSLLFLSTTSAAATTSLSLSSSAATPPTPLPDTTVTDRVFMDFSICPNYFLNRTLGDDLSLCADSEPVGRLVLGLYGNLVPITVSNFKAMCTASSGYKGTLVQKIFPGQFFVAGRQGRREGEVRPPVDLARNTEAVNSQAFLLGHSRPGVVSLCLSENDDDDEFKLDPNYRNVEFLITTGPAPCPQLDNNNIVFGMVLEGLDVVTTIASIPTYKPAERIRQYNDLAQFLGDERAKTARAIWNKPLKTVYIRDCGELKVAKPTLSPTLP